MHILVVEDDAAVALWVQRVFEEDGDRVDMASTAEMALGLSASVAYDLVLVDLGLPGTDGATLVTSLRERSQLQPILILTGRGRDEDVALGLDAGADDYLTKPVSATVLRARTRAVLRRSMAGAPAGDASTDRLVPETTSADEITVGKLALSRTTRRVRGLQGEAELTAKEYALLEFLMARPGQVVPRERLLQHAWGYTFDPGTNVVEVALSRLRQKVAGVGAPVRLRTLRGMGVTLESDGA